jgi:hypothetical protein
VEANKLEKTVNIIGDGLTISTGPRGPVLNLARRMEVISTGLYFSAGSGSHVGGSEPLMFASPKNQYPSSPVMIKEGTTTRSSSAPSAFFVSSSLTALTPFELSLPILLIF